MHSSCTFLPSQQEQSREDAVELKEEDVIPNTPSLITFSSRGYIKRMPASTWDVQKRGGKGGSAAGMVWVHLCVLTRVPSVAIGSRQFENRTVQLCAATNAKKLLPRC